MARRFCFLVFGVFLSLCSGGCGSILKQAPVAKAFFAIDPGQPQSAGSTRPSTHPAREFLRVAALRISPPYDGLPFVYRIGPSQFDTDYYNNFIAPPASLLTGAMVQWLDQSAAVQVCDPSSQVPANLILEGNITELYIDSTNAASPRAVIAGRFFLLRDHNGAMELLWEKHLEGSAPASARSPAAFAAAWGQAYRQLLTKLTDDLREVLTRR